jgi:hypothetical protein
MTIFSGQLQRENEEPLRVHLQIDEDRCRIWTDRRRLGSWQLNDVHTERASVFRFILHLDGADVSFTPDDPSGFSDAMGAVIDLRPARSRFGLAERLRAVQEASQ